MKLGLTISLLLMNAAFSNFCADTDSKEISAIIYGEHKFNIPDHLSQAHGTICFNGIWTEDSPHEIYVNGIGANPSLRSREIVRKIHSYCQSEDNVKITEAEKLLVQIPQETDLEKLHHCVALVLLGEAHLPNPKACDSAVSYFTEAWRTHNFTGAALKLASIQCSYDHFAVLYYFFKAQRAGHEGSSPEKLIEHLYIENKEEALQTMKEILTFEEQNLYS